MAALAPNHVNALGVALDTDRDAAAAEMHCFHEVNAQIHAGAARDRGNTEREPHATAECETILPRNVQGNWQQLQKSRCLWHACL